MCALYSESDVQMASCVCVCGVVWCGVVWCGVCVWCVCVRACVRACVCVRRRRKKAVPYVVCSRALVCGNKLYSTLKWSMVTKSGKKGRMSSILSRLHSFRNIIALWRVRGRSGGESFTELNNKTAECESLTGGVRESCVQCVRVSLVV